MRVRLPGLLLGLILASVPAVAHHSFSAEYDVDKPITLKGTLTKLDWVNPHGWIYIDVKGEGGKVTNWAVEFGGPNALLRRGVRKTDFPVGGGSDGSGLSGKERNRDHQRQERQTARRARFLYRIVRSG